jgi:hypothetical protein
MKTCYFDESGHERKIKESSSGKRLNIKENNGGFGTFIGCTILVDNSKINSISNSLKKLKALCNEPKELKGSKVLGSKRDYEYSISRLNQKKCQRICAVAQIVAENNIDVQLSFLPHELQIRNSLYDSIIFKDTFQQRLNREAKFDVANRIIFHKIFMYLDSDELKVLIASNQIKEAVNMFSDLLGEKECLFENYHQNIINETLEIDLDFKNQFKQSNSKLDNHLRLNNDIKLEMEASIIAYRHYINIKMFHKQMKKYAFKNNTYIETFDYANITNGPASLLNELNLDEKEVKFIVDEEKKIYKYFNQKFSNVEQSTFDEDILLALPDLIAYVYSKILTGIYSYFEKLPANELTLLDQEFFKLDKLQFNTIKKIDSILTQNYNYNGTTTYVFDHNVLTMFSYLKYISYFENFEEFEVVLSKTHIDEVNKITVNYLQNKYDAMGI